MHDLVAVEGFEPKNTNEYSLSIQVSLDGFSFSMLRGYDKKIMACKNTPLKISSEQLISRHFSEWFQNEELLNTHFKKISVVVFSDKFSLVPEALFSQKIKRDLPLYLFAEKGEMEIAENFVERIKAKLIFALPTGLNKILADNVGECEIIHPLKLLINGMPDSSDHNQLALLFGQKSFYAVLYKKNNMALANNYKIAHPNDVVYFTLNLLKQMKLEPRETQLLLVNAEPDIAELLSPYFTHIKKLEPGANIANPEISVSPILDLIPTNN